MDWTGPSSWRDRRVLVTGASGFLGAAVCARLLAAEADVHGSHRTRFVPPGVQARLAAGPQALAAAVDALAPDVVIHLASPVDLRREAELYDELRPGILDSTVAVAGACMRSGARMVQVGTCEELAGGSVPFRPDAVAPTSPYSALKVAASAWVMAATRSLGLRATVVRPFRCFGPGEQKGLVPAACRAAVHMQPFPMTDGGQVREWNHVDAVAAGIVAAAAHPGAIGRQLNLGGGPHHAVRAVVERIFELAGADPALIQAGALPRRPGEVEQFWGDHGATLALLGPLPHVDLDEGLRQTLAGIRKEAS